jgi:hypothetical protein
MSLPESTEFVGELCFQGCISLSKFTISSPSHLRELMDLPVKLTGVICISDSVEMLGFHVDDPRAVQRTLMFGRDSRLAEMKLVSTEEWLPARSFLQVSSRSVKGFRTNFEWKEDPEP